MVRLGIDRLLANPSAFLAGKPRVALLTHAASITSDGRHCVDALLSSDAVTLTRLFSPEHGIFGGAQDMIGVCDGLTYRGIPVTSLYGETLSSLWPTLEALQDSDVLIVDLQDIGTRYYTYVYTMAFCMERAKQAGVSVLVCDRPNPLGGV